MCFTTYLVLLLSYSHRKHRQKHHLTVTVNKPQPRRIEIFHSRRQSQSLPTPRHRVDSCMMRVLPLSSHKYRSGQATTPSSTITSTKQRQSNSIPSSNTHTTLPTRTTTTNMTVLPPGSRVPAALQQIFLQSQRGDDVEKISAPKKLGFRVFGRKGKQKGIQLGGDSKRGAPSLSKLYLDRGDGKETAAAASRKAIRKRNDESSSVSFFLLVWRKTAVFPRVLEMCWSHREFFSCVCPKSHFNVPLSLSPSYFVFCNP